MRRIQKHQESDINLSFDSFKQRANVNSNDRKSSTSCPPQLQEKYNFASECIIYSWGQNKDGELSLGKVEEQKGSKDSCISVPSKVKGIQEHQISHISSGGHHTSCVTKSGLLLVCGSYLHGKLGLPKRTSVCVTKFQQVTKVQNQKVIQSVCGEYHTACLMDDGSVYAWGGSVNDKLGRRASLKADQMPGLINPLKSKFITQIACGDYHTMAIEQDGSLWTWGGGATTYNKGQCGHGNNENVNKPERVKFFEGKQVTLIAAGGFHSLALAGYEEQILYAWGSGVYGETGNGEFADTNSPKVVKLGSILSKQEPSHKEGGDKVYIQGLLNTYSESIVKVAAGGHHSMVLTSKNRVFSFGFGAYGQLGTTYSQNYNVPQEVKTISHLQVTDICVGWNHSLMLTKSGQVYSTGVGKNGQLGHGDFDSKKHFTLVEALKEYKITKIFAGGNHSWAIVADYQELAMLNKSEELPYDQMQISKVSMDDQELLLNDSPQHMLADLYNFQMNFKPSQTSYNHRFVRMEVKEENIDTFKDMILNYVDYMTTIEGEELLHHQYKTDQQLIIFIVGSSKTTMSKMIKEIWCQAEQELIKV